MGEPRNVPNVLKISEAASLALHAMVYLAGRDGQPVSTRAIAETLSASEAHMSKVLQRLARTGLVRPIRGPKGGFVLGRPASRTSLLNVYEAIEGPLASSNCLFEASACRGKRCILGGLLPTVNRQVKDYLKRTTLAKLATIYRGPHADSKKNH